MFWLNISESLDELISKLKSYLSINTPAKFKVISWVPSKRAGLLTALRTPLTFIYLTFFSKVGLKCNLLNLVWQNNLTYLFVKWVFLWIFKLLFELHILGHRVQWKGLSPLCFRLCVLKLNFWTNLCKHPGKSQEKVGWMTLCLR